MAYSFFNDKDEGIKSINMLLAKCDICFLHDVYQCLLRHFNPHVRPTAYLYFPDVESHIIGINNFMEDCEVDTLNRVYTLLLKHFYPTCI